MIEQLKCLNCGKVLTEIDSDTTGIIIKICPRCKKKWEFTRRKQINISIIKTVREIKL